MNDRSESNKSTDAPFTRTVTERMVAFGSGQMETFRQALEGDPEATGMVYGMVAALVREGLPIPAPVSDFIADRLDEVGAILRGERGSDVRKELPAAVNPHPRGMREVGPRGDAGDLRPAAEYVIDMSQMHPERGRKKQFIASMAASEGVSFATMQRKVAEIEKERREAGPPP